MVEAITTDVGKPRPFGAVVRDLLIDQGITTALGNPNWRAFAGSLDTLQYESLRKAATGERWPSPKIMETVAEALRVNPSIFWEYELWQAQRQFDPREVGEENALIALRAWSDSQTK